MKKILFFGALMLLIISRVGAQSAIVLSESNTQILPGPFHYSVSYPKALTLPVSGSNIKWDYSNLKKDSNVGQAFVANYSTPFTSSKTAIADTSLREFLTSNSNFKETGFYDEDKTGLFFAGDFVTNQYFSLASYFNNSSDNIIIPQQNDSVRLNIIRFPETANTCERYKAIRSLYFTWNVSSANLNDAPSIKKTFYNVIDTVTGWGTLRVPAIAAKSIAYPVLLARRKVVTIDSYYVNDKPASKFFLIAFGIVQGTKTTDCNEYFYRVGHQNPLISIGFGADTTYSTPTSVLFSTDSIKKQSGVEIPGQENDNFTFYPNPANSDFVNCSFFKGNNEHWKLLIFNSIGEVFKTETIQGNGKINMAVSIIGAKSGLYFVSVFDEYGIPMASSRLSIIH